MNKNLENTVTSEVEIPTSKRARKPLTGWSRPGIPHKGWIITGITDLGPDNGQLCEMCEE